MAVTQTWTNPSTGGAIDLNTDDTLVETVWDLLLSCFAALGGTAGPPHTQATRGVFPVSGYLMGALAHDMHIEEGTVEVTRNAGRTGNAAVTFDNAFASAPRVWCQIVTKANPEGWWPSSITGNGFTLNDYSAETDTVTYYWLAIGSDV